MKVGVDRVHALVLELVSLDLCAESNPSPFVAAQVDHNATTSLLQTLESEVELSVLLPAHTKGKDVRPEILPADLSTPQSLGKQTVVVRRRTAAHPRARPASNPRLARDPARDVARWLTIAARRPRRLRPHTRGTG